MKTKFKAGRNKIVSLFLVFAMAAMIVPVMTVSSSATTISLKGMGLTNAQVARLESQLAVTSATSLNFNNMGLTDTQLAQLVANGVISQNVTHLFLGNNQISNLAPLSGLNNLEVLLFINNQISDIAPLIGLTNLEVLYY